MGCVVLLSISHRGSFFGGSLVGLDGVDGEGRDGGVACAVCSLWGLTLTAGRLCVMEVARVFYFDSTYMLLFGWSERIGMVIVLRGEVRNLKIEVYCWRSTYIGEFDEMVEVFVVRL
jgi:hypothetical protein